MPKVSDRINRMDRIEEAPEAYDLGGTVIGLATKVHSALGPGFLRLRRRMTFSKSRSLSDLPVHFVNSAHSV